ncbi:MAG: hypothetical protein AB1792_06950 [Candidatus Zixiibacteriota bacterium]
MEIIFATGHYSSKVMKSASIICNSTGFVPGLSISAFPIKSPDSMTVFTCTPYALDLDTDRPDGQKHAWEYEVKVKNVSSADLALSVVSQPDRFIRVEAPKSDIGPGKEKTIKIKIEPDVADTLFTKSFTLEASDSAKTRFTFPIKKAMRWGPAPTSSR